MTEAEYLAHRIAELRSTLSAVMAQAETLPRQAEAKVEALMQEAGILAEVQKIRKESEQAQRQSNVRKIALSARIEELEKVLDQYHRFPVAPGTVVHGIDVSRLDWESRARVMSGDLETIAALGGRLVEDGIPGYDSPSLVSVEVVESD